MQKFDYLVRSAANFADASRWCCPGHFASPSGGDAFTDYELEFVAVKDASQGGF